MAGPGVGDNPGGPTDTFTGDQHNGVISGVDFNSAPVFTVNVNSLSGAITPGTGKSGISMTNGAAGNITINGGLSGAPITISSTNAAGISILSIGNPGAPTPNAFLNNIPVPGTPGASGGEATVNSFSNITTTGVASYGISAKSSTGGYDFGSVIQPLLNFTPANISFTVSSTGTFAATRVSVTSGTNDGSITPVGAGDQVVLSSDGSFTFISGTTFASLANGSTMYVSVPITVTGTNTSTHGTDVESGTLIVSVTKTGSNSFTTGTFGANFNTFGPSSSVFPDLPAYVAGLAASAQAGGAGNSVTVASSGSIQTSGSTSHGIFATSQGGNGGGGRDASITHSSTQGGPGSIGGTVSVTADGYISTTGNNAAGVLAWSLGGSGGKGGDSGYTRNSKAGGAGGTGGEADVYGGGTIVTSGTQSSGIIAFSQGGNGGGGGAGSTFNSADDGGAGGMGGTVHVSGSWNITTTGDQAHGIWAKSLGGVAGGGGDGGWTGTSSGSGGQGTRGGDVFVFSDGRITVGGSNAFGIYAESVGGFGGNGGDGTSIFYSAGGSGASAGSGGDVTVSTGTNSVIRTTGIYGNGIFAQSVGGGGGSGGGGGALVTIGGTGSTGGNGGNVSVTNSGSIQVTGSQARGIYAQSIGGGGGDGGNAAGLVAIGGNGSTTSAGGTVAVANFGTIEATSNAILAQSIGGGGGNGGSSGGWFSFGGKGGGGGDAGTVAVTSNGDLSTTEVNSSAIFAQSLGGGGGNGGNSVAVGAFVSVSIGGGGAKGGDGKKVTVGIDPTDGTTVVPVTGVITTIGDNSDGIQAQSVGGGGGNGGFAVSVSGAPAGAVSIGIGGNGGNGGNAGEVDAYYGGSRIQTSGANANGIFAQSIGGGGGSGGFSIAVGFSAGATGAFSMGGSGGSGGNAGAVNVGSSSNPLLGQIITTGNHSYGVLAQSVGGGGGNGGFSVAGSMTVGSVGGALSFGGDGGKGGTGSDVTLYSNSSVSTTGTDSHGLFAQSVGGGGGSGGASVTAILSTGGAVGVSFGGNGGAGNGAGNVTLVSTGTSIMTTGDRSDGILAQSVGGGGGNGGLSVAGSVSAGPALNFSMGGSGGLGGNAGTVSITNSSSISTGGADSHGIFAQSVGGGGGSGGFSIAAALSFSPAGGGGAALNASIGGSGTAGGNASSVTVIDTGTASSIMTTGEHSYGILAQSVGGGGGDGGFSVAGGISNGPTISFSMGGSGGGGGDAGTVQVLDNSYISTTGNNSHAIFAQSIGGGGGSGGFSITGNLSSSAGVGVSLGGTGGGGGNARNVMVGVTITGTDGTTHLPTFTASPITGGISTTGNHSDGILAQSIGGSGGDGGFSIAGGITSSASVNFSMGGDGGNGGATGDVVVDSASAIMTTGTNSHGIFAQSVGGGGGSGGFSVTGGISAGSAAVGASIGGNGSQGGDGETVQVISSGSLIYTMQNHSDGILAQSVGGGGGDGGFSVTGNASESAAVGFSMGGGGAGGGISSIVSVINTSNITTLGDDSFGILAQSVGGGGGSGGFSVEGGISTNSGAVNASIGGFAGGGGSSGDVFLSSGGGIVIATSGNRSTALVAQSIGGGGGSGGFSIAGGLSESTNVNFSMGGSGGTGGDGGRVTLSSSSAILTTGSDSHGILAQSVGGGGGDGGFSIAGGISTGSASAISASIGGSGTSGGNANTVSVTSSGSSIYTEGNNSDGILAQSVGGGGGDGGFSIAGDISKSSSVSLSVGGSGGIGGSGSDTVVINSSSITTLGSASTGILAQSVGGGGGNGGFSLAGSIASGSDSSGVTFSMGGKGGVGGEAGAVTVLNTGNIFTGGTNALGNGSDGIIAQSIGGGGGNGGFSGAITGGFGNSKNLAFSIGGSAGGGNNAGTVTLNSHGNVVTTGTGSVALFAQSVGGGGGDGGFSLSAVLNTGTAASTNLSVSIGGKGGSGGQGGVVVVGGTYNGGSGTGAFTAAPVTGTLITTGSSADAIFAQSVGGGGGNGGFSAAGTLSSSGTGTKQLDVSIGGSGGTASSGDTVYVNTGATLIMTTGESSIGILAQSIGGGGGNGGMSFTGAFQNSPGTNLSLTLGGNGAGGGDGGEVDLISNNPIVTIGNDSHGVFAQSVGGGGGTGGLSGSVDVGTSGSAATTTMNLGVSIGGSGAGGGKGGAVNVTTSGGISTTGDESHAIFAQSIGGGGGAGGGSVQGTVSLKSQSPGTVYNISVGVGGSGGTGNTGGNVTVVNSGSLVTQGDGSHGIYAQSIGGGGGQGGTARTFTLNLPGGTEKDEDGKPIDGKKQNKSMAIAIGGNGGSGNISGTVAVTNTGNITTMGGNSYGIFAQSVGGGGGDGGTGVQGSGVPVPGVDKVGILKNLQVSVGGTGGSGNNGNLVTVIQTGTITTTGTGSYGILAQSIGGGGGVGGAADIGATGKVGIGGAGGSSNDGKEVDVTLNLGSAVITTGQGATAILAQSIGGGGGVSGNVTRGLAAYANLGIGLAFGQSGGGGGDGGVVTINTTANIGTMGDGADGIFAQSVGGGGGLVGNLGNDLPLLSYLNFAGSVGGSGSASAVTVTHTGNIITMGEASQGIFAQSAAGSGTSGVVTVNLTGNIYATGTDSNGILAQSTGLGAANNVVVTINSGTVEGGVWSGTAGSTPAGVHILDGNNNTLTNGGLVASYQGLASGYAILSTVSGSSKGLNNDTVNDNGIVIGSVDLGGGTNTYNHNSGSLLMSGDIIMLGTGNYFYNSGTIAPGGMDAVQTTTLTGNFTQTGSASWLFDITPQITSDLFAISGTASLTNVNTVNLNENGLATTTGTYTLITAHSGLSGTFRLGSFTGGSMPAGFTYSLINSDTQEQLSFAVSSGTFYWRGAVDNTWNSGFLDGQSNFTRDVAGTDFIFGTPGALVDVVFSSTNPSTANQATVLGADFAVNSLTISDTNAISIGGTNSLTIVAAGGAGITMNSGAGTAVIGMKELILAGSQTWTNDSLNALDIISDSITGAGKNLTIQGTGTTNITSVIATGSGALVKGGAGTLVLYAANTYSGGSYLKYGNVVAANENALGTGNVNVLGGVLRTTNTAVTSSTIPLHLNVGGTYTQAIPATLVLRILGPTDVNDRLVITGNANLAGTFMPDYSVTGYNPVPPAGKYTDAYNVVHADGGIAGKFTFVDVHYDADKLLRWEPVYGTNDVMLEWNQHPFTSESLAEVGITLTPNQVSVADAINVQMGLPSPAVSKPYNESTGPALDAHPGMAAGINFLNNEPLKNLPGDYDLISPDQLSAIFSIQNALADMQGSNIENRLWDIRNGGGSGFNATGFNLQNDHGSINIATLAFASPTGTGEDVPEPVASSGDGKSAMRYKTELRPESDRNPRWGVFIAGGGEFAHVGSDLNANGYNFTTGGVTLGADYRANDHFAVGIMGGYANTTTRLSNSGAIGVNSGKIGIYSTLYGGGFYANTLVTGGFDTYDTHRSALGGTALGSTSGGEFDGLLSGGYDAHFGKFTVGPVASMQYTYVEINDFTERNSLFPVRVPSQNQESLRTKFGIKASYDWKTQGGIVVTPMAGASWQHEFLNSGFGLDASFAQGAGNLFNVQGPVIGRDSAIITVGINVQWTQRFGTYLSYDGEFGRRNYQINSVSGGAKLNF